MNRNSPWDHPKVFAIEQAVTATDCDAFDHVNNAVYVAWQDRVAWAHSSHLGFDQQGYMKLGVGYVVRDNHLTYELPVQAGDALWLGTWVLSNDKRLRCERGFQFIRQSDGKTVFRGRITYVSFDLKRQKPTRTPPELQRAYQAFKRDP